MEVYHEETNLNQEVSETFRARGNLIQDFYQGKVVLVTGGTGFVGKVLVEKLLRSCPNISVVYLLMRTKRGQDEATRFRQFLTSSVFDRLRSECGANVLDKTRPIAGDVAEPGLGLSQEDRQRLIDEVDIVFHSAATVRFDEELRKAVSLNVCGLRSVVVLAKEMRKLKALVHVSTAYNNADKRLVEERVYPPPADPEAIIRLCKNLDEEKLAAVAKDLVKGHPNTYTFTKAIAEWILQEEGAGLPCAMVRPSIVTAAWREPEPGWIDNVTGIAGLALELSRGTFRSMIGKPDFVADLVPVDVVANTLIVAGWRAATNRSKPLVVYNCTSGSVNPIRWHKYIQILCEAAVATPTRYVQWYPYFTFRTNRIIHAAVEMLCHFPLAFVSDVMLRVQGAKPIITRIAKKTRKTAQEVEFFSTREWIFYTDTIRALSQDLSLSGDRGLFDFDMTRIQWEPYVRNNMAGIMKFYLKNTPDTMEAARKKVKRMYWMNKMTQLLPIILVAIAAQSFIRRL